MNDDASFYLSSFYKGLLFSFYSDLFLFYSPRRLHQTNYPQTNPQTNHYEIFSACAVYG